jgi:hypothetical protein
MKLFFNKTHFILGWGLFSSLCVFSQTQTLSLAKPYCFLLPSKNAFALKCAHESVQNIVKQYARGGVHVVPVFRWWGNDHSEDPGALEQQAKEACNLDKAFPWAQGAGSIQVFTANDNIPSRMCGQDPIKDPVAGCSNLCPSGSPSFSTVSGTSCSAGVSIHESGHSNCCGSHCHNEGSPECQPNSIDGGCGLCLKGGGTTARSFFEKTFLASKATGGASCQLTEAALASIRQGAVKNPGYLYDPEKQYKIRGKQLKSIFGKNGVKKLLKGVGDPPSEGSNNLSGNVPPSQEDLKEANPRRKIPLGGGGRNAASTQEGGDAGTGSQRTTYTSTEGEQLAD